MPARAAPVGHKAIPRGPHTQVLSGEVGALGDLINVVAQQAQDVDGLRIGGVQVDDCGQGGECDVQEFAFDVVQQGREAGEVTGSLKVSKVNGRILPDASKLPPQLTASGPPCGFGASRPSPLPVH